MTPHQGDPALNIFGTHDEKTIVQLADVASRAERVALMADGHVGYVMPIGGVAAYRNKVSVVGVGFDIACGNAAILTDRFIHDYSRRELEDLANEIHRSISFGVGLSNRSGDAPHDDALFKDDAWKALDPAIENPLREKARDQLGTVGAGNHYVDVFSDEHGRVWVGVHFGSRGFGHTVASGFLALSQHQKWGSRVPEREALLDLASPMGEEYWALMNLGGRYAYAGREWVARKTVSILGGKELDIVHNHHNFAWKEIHGGEELIVVRKGATPAYPNQRGFVGGSMGDDAVILEGTMDSPEQSEAALWSTVHGAGRVMSRTEARGKRKGWGAKARIITPGKVSWEMVNEWLGPKGVILRGGGLDEAPHAYRR
ncbi:MAG TPA: RtcB family protein, partial [Gemmatimonadaceae bacterium]|nr:RtcB family protein [Gemmatimonadaceae bacterium]